MFIAGPRLDDLECAYAGMKALTKEEAKEYINLCAVFDNEEIGSGTKQGADSTFLKDVLVRICTKLGLGEEEYRCMLADSFLISADNAHALHPNHPEKADTANRPVLNGGIVIKYHGSQKYATDAYSSAVMKDICHKAKVPYQAYANRSDIVGGSTLGNISTAQVSVNTVDIGLPQLAMHSALETAGAKDIVYLLEALQTLQAINNSRENARKSLCKRNVMEQNHYGSGMLKGFAAPLAVVVATCSRYSVGVQSKYLLKSLLK